MSDNAIHNAEAWMENIREMVDALNAANGKGAADDEARQAIEEAPLSVRVRGGWYSPAGDGDRGSPEEFEILLTTGGPALRIIGELDQWCQPERPRLQWQDWGTPWTDFLDTSEEDDAAMQTFVEQFYFG